MSLNLDPYKPANAETPISSAKMRNSYDAITNHVNSLPPANIQGYPGSSAVFLSGNGNWSSPGTGPIVTALPGGPVDNQVCVYQADATNKIYWQLQYQQSNNVWLKTGGPPMFARVDAQETITTANTFVDLGTVGPTLTVPLAATGYAQFGSGCVVPGGAVVLTVGLNLNALPLDDDALHFQFSSASQLHSMVLRKVDVTVGMVIKLQYKQDQNGTRSFKNRWLTFDPIFVS